MSYQPDRLNPEPLEKLLLLNPDELEELRKEDEELKEDDEDLLRRRAAASRFWRIFASLSSAAAMDCRARLLAKAAVRLASE